MNYQKFKRSLKRWFGALTPFSIHPKSKTSMIGAGLIHKGEKLITHTTLSHNQSALITFAPWQIVTFILLTLSLILGLIFNPLIAITGVIGFLSLVYFTDVIFNIYVILKSLYHPPEIAFDSSMVKKIDEKSLPVYSILCPLFREANVLPQFISSLNKLDWPKEKLDVLLLLEEDDKETLNKARSLALPSFVRIVKVPHSLPKTKPKACNFGLSRAKGELLVIFDAEDRPEPDQLKKAYLGFLKLPQDIVCLQAKLNYYNPHQNLLTRLFSAEYSLWFDVILTGLQSIGTTIPLGGTSNHFKVSVLKDLKGWDPFNVTEDCDLGVRLFKKGFKTAIIDSTTWEEANSQIKNWLRQRSRWIKGYLQTFLVHNRNPLEFVRRHGIHAFIFQLIIGTRMSFMLINPFLWLLTISYFALYSIVGPTIESFYPAPIFYVAVFSLVFGNFMYVYNYMIGCAKRRQWNLVKYVYFIPLYWLMASIAATVALFQLITKPHYWEKTIHGLHFKEDKSINETPTQVEPAQTISKLFAALASKKTYIGGFLLICASVAANFLNFLFNTFLGRVLEFHEFALIGLIGGFLSFSSILFGAFYTTANFKSGFLIGKYGETLAYSFWRTLRVKTLYFSVILSALWILSTPFLMRYFDTNNLYLFTTFGAVLLVGLIHSANRGLLSAKFMFGSLALLSFLDPVVKLVLAFLFVYLGLKTWTFTTIPASFLITFLVGLLLITWKVSFKKSRALKTHKLLHEIKSFPKKFFAASFLTEFSTAAFLTMDILLANHFLTRTEAGQYTLLSLVAKMIYFLGSLTSPFITPLVSRSEGTNKQSLKTLYTLLASTTLLSLLGFVAFGLFGYFTIPLLYGPKALVIVPYITLFTFGMMCFTISRVFLSYYLVKRVLSFTAVSFILVILQFTLIQLNHGGIASFAASMQLLWGISLLAVLVLHLNIKRVQNLERGLFDLFSFKIKKHTENEQVLSFRNKLNILVFNWRDTKHKWAGGAEVYIHELAKRWVKDGNHVTLFCGNGTKRPNGKIDGVEVIRKGSFYTVYIWAFLYYIFKFRGKFDVIIDCENGIPFFTPLYSRKPKFLLIHHVHQEVFRKSLKPPFSYLAVFLETKLMPLVYRNIQVITVSPSSKEEILKLSLTKVEPAVIYNGIDLNKFKVGVKNKHPLILYVGRLQYYKSLHVFIEAAKKVLEKIPQAEFVIAGEGERRKRLEKYALSLGIAEKIKFLGQVSERKKISLFQKAWAFVNPSFMEGWGITTLEANACGTLAIASNVPGLRDSIKNPHTGFLVPYGDSKEFASKIIKIIKDEELRNKLSKEATNWSKEFTWEKSATEFYSLVINKVGIKDESREKQESLEKALASA